MSVDDSFVPCRIDKPNPFEVLFALIYMGVGMFCLIGVSGGWNAGRFFSDSRC